MTAPGGCRWPRARPREARRRFGAARLGLLLVLLALALTGCSGEETTGRETGVAGATALTWGSGPYGVVLAHGASYDAASWEDQAVRIAALDMTVLAVEDISQDGIRAGVRHLREDGIGDVALVGGSAGADAILRLAAAEPGLADQLVVLSPNSVVEGLGRQPKLFIASEDEPLAGVSTRMAESAPGRDNTAVLLPGDAHAQGIFAGDQGETALRLLLDRLERYAGG